MSKTVIIGGGASGLMCAITAAKLNKEVILIEKNEKLGKKLYITGKGRCNLTNDISSQEFFSFVVNNPKFLTSSIYNFSPENTISFFNENGLELKTERGNRVFPLSDKSSDVIKTLENACKKAGVSIKLNTEVKDIIFNDGKICGVKTDNGEILCDSVVVCTGGLSYPLTGSTGDGYSFAKKVGHKIVNLKPALCPIELKGDFYKKLQGLSLKNVNITVFNGEKVVYSDFGEMLFTHFGVSGPIILSCSSVINKYQVNTLKMFIDFKPALTFDVLEQRILREIDNFKNKNFTFVLATLLPKSLIPEVLSRCNIDGSKKSSFITKEERKTLVKTLKNFECDLSKIRPIDEAIITSGGVSVNEINPKTMESKLCKGLFFAGEVIDVDCFTGGFNIQTAFSTGVTAGKNC